MHLHIVYIHCTCINVYIYIQYTLYTHGNLTIHMIIQYDTVMTKYFFSEFEMLSCSLLTACYHNYDKSEWINILTVKMKGSSFYFDLYFHSLSLYLSHFSFSLISFS